MGMGRGPRRGGGLAAQAPNTRSLLAARCTLVWPQCFWPSQPCKPGAGPQMGAECNVVPGYMLLPSGPYCSNACRTAALERLTAPPLPFPTAAAKVVSEEVRERLTARPFPPPPTHPLPTAAAKVVIEEVRSASLHVSSPHPPHTHPLLAAAKVVSEEVRKRIAAQQAQLAAAEAARPLSATQIARLQLQVAQVLQPGETVTRCGWERKGEGRGRQGPAGGGVG